jgi:glycosyltransferase involved in cell wall biosynthesis
MTDPAVSVILPVKNGEPFVGQAIESILTQDPPPAELIVVDGASTDGSAETARSEPRVRLLEQKGDGLTGAWNQGLAASTGGLIAFLDSDDYWLPGKLEAQIRMLDEDPGLAGTIGKARFVVEAGAEAPPGFRLHLLEGDGEHMAPMPGTLLVRREVFDQVGIFDEDYVLAADVDWFARVKDAGLVFGPLDQAVLVKRFHAHNLSHSRPEVYEREMVRAMRDSAARQRSGARP